MPKSDEFKQIEMHVYKRLREEGLDEDRAETQAEIITQQHLDLCKADGLDPMDNLHKIRWATS